MGKNGALHPRVILHAAILAPERPGLPKTINNKQQKQLPGETVCADPKSDTHQSPQTRAWAAGPALPDVKQYDPPHAGPHQWPRRPVLCPLMSHCIWGCPYRAAIWGMPRYMVRMPRIARHHYLDAAPLRSMPPWTQPRSAREHAPCTGVPFVCRCQLLAFLAPWTSDRVQPKGGR